MSRKDLEAKKRHHYVWAKYLTRWGRGTKNVFYTTKTGKIAHDSVRAVVVDDYFYKTTTLTSKHVEVIKGFSRKSPDHMIEFMMFFGHQISRTKPLRDGVFRAQPRGNAIEIEVADAMAHAWWFLRLGRKVLGPRVVPAKRIFPELCFR